MNCTCPICESQMHAHGDLLAWITTDGRVVIEMASPSPTAQRWLELTMSRQNWLAEILRMAHDTQTQQRRTA